MLRIQPASANLRNLFIKALSLRFISREMVDGLTFIALAMSFFFVPFFVNFL